MHRMASELIKKSLVNQQSNIADLLEHDEAAFAVVKKGEGAIRTDIT